MFREIIEPNSYFVSQNEHIASTKENILEYIRGLSFLKKNSNLENALALLEHIEE
jgi:hypothetical protein